MLDKLRAFAEASKNVIIYILTPIAFVLGIIYYLFTKNRDLETELKAKDGNDKLKELHGQQIEIDTSANDADDEYERVRRKHLSGRDSGGGQGDSSA